MLRETFRKKYFEAKNRVFGGSLDLSHIFGRGKWHNVKKYRLTIKRGFLRVKALPVQVLMPDGFTYQQSGSFGGRGLRGEITGFSRASRKRMIELFSSIRNEGEMSFVTLTYPDLYPDEPAIWKQHFEQLRHRIKRFGYEDGLGIVWRLELKSRQSGVNAGKIAPHYHFLAFIPDAGENSMMSSQEYSEAFGNWLYEAWHDIVANNWLRAIPSDMVGDTWQIEDVLDADGNIKVGEVTKHLGHGVFYAPVYDKKHAMYYCSKYLAKIDGDMVACGRRWGVMGRANLDVSPSYTEDILEWEYKHLRRSISAWGKSKGGKSAVMAEKIKSHQRGWGGFTIFGLGDGNNLGASTASRMMAQAKTLQKSDERQHEHYLFDAPSPVSERRYSSHLDTHWV